MLGGSKLHCHPKDICAYAEMPSDAAVVCYTPIVQSFHISVPSL